jgi:hypothetical protein
MLEGSSELCYLVSWGAPSHSIGFCMCFWAGDWVEEVVRLIVFHCGVEVKCAQEVPVAWVEDLYLG